MTLRPSVDFTFIQTIVHYSQFMHGAGEIAGAAQKYAEEVRSRAFPSADQTYRPKS